MGDVPSGILLVEDDPGQARLARRALERAGYSVCWLATAADCLQRVRATLPAVVLLDRGLPDRDGLEVLATLHEEWPDVGVIMLTGADDVTVAVQAMRCGAWDYLLKRPDLSHLDDLPLVVERNLERVRLRHERATLDAAVRASEERYRELFDNASDFIVVCDEEGVIQKANEPFRDLTGIAADAALGQDLETFIAAGSPTRARDLCRRVRESDRQPVTVEVHLRGATGEAVVVELRARPVNEGKMGRGFQAIGRDVTEKRRMDDLKADFLAMVTHDMKNPVGVIVGYTGILLDDLCSNSACRQMLASIDANARGLLQLIANFLDLSRIEASALQLNRVPADLNARLRGVIRDEAPLARLKNIEIVECFGDVPEVSVDPAQIDRVFANLIGNAIKFTPAGGRVTVSTAANKGGTVVKVSDTGPGIPAEDVPELFAKYGRLPEGAQTQGTGLGLYVAKSMVDAHGGSVRAESRPGAGATFVVELPAV